MAGPKEKDHTYFVGVAGNIGAGKTTLTDIIAERFNWKPYYEMVIDNPYLSDFYGDMRRWSFNLQIFF
ncbi:MAG: deoxynucleoside kinase, partial [Candidatus Marinimicrobia bacterium]|nr:deoxynucleoside kinase [Candidatus Neomarinimicrobiota bacterium]